jgi:hypothetical protein
VPRHLRIDSAVGEAAIFLYTHRMTRACTEEAATPLRRRSRRLRSVSAFACGAALAALFAAAPALAEDPAQVVGLEQRMASDPDTMSAISALQDTPEMKAVLADEELIEALQRGDIDKVLANPKVARLAADPRVQELTKKYGR